MHFSSTLTPLQPCSLGRHTMLRSNLRLAGVLVLILLFSRGGRSADERDADRRGADDKADKAPSQIAHIRLAGGLDEAPTAVDPLFGSSHENFKAKIDRIHKAQNDTAVGALYIHLDGLNVGWAKMDELRAAL